jgi:hypothetical protein
MGEDGAPVTPVCSFPTECGFVRRLTPPNSGLPASEAYRGTGGSSSPRRLPM